MRDQDTLADTVNSLRYWYESDHTIYFFCDEAANAIEKMEREIAELREQLAAERERALKLVGLCEAMIEDMRASVWQPEYHAKRFAEIVANAHPHRSHATQRHILIQYPRVPRI